jgi:hypothetical protein
MSYGGQEIFNGPRTKAYLQHLQPTLSVGDDCCECDTLAAALGDAPYGTPAQDDAEWFNAYAPETGGFYGLLPLAVEGFEDSTWQVPITDLMGDGSVAGRGRRGGRDLRFRMLAVAESEKAMSRGLSWLRDALGAEGCATGDCGGAQVCYLTDCPGCCAEDAPEALETVDHLDYRALTTAAAATAGAADWTSAVVPKGYKTTPGQTYVWWDDRGGVEVERLIDGFVPGMVYRLALDFGSTEGDAEEIRVSIPGASELLAPRRVDEGFGFATQPAQGVVVWEFIATECQHRVVITSTSDLLVGMLDVSMTTLDALAYSAQPAYYPSQAMPWTAPLLSDPAYLVTQPAAGRWVFAGVSSATIGIGVGEVVTVLPGLQPGRTYRVTLLSTVDTETGGVYTGRAGVVTVSNALGSVLALAETTPGPLGTTLHGGWTTLEFTADDRAAYLSVANGVAATVTPTAHLVVSVRSVVVEETAPVVVAPDPTDALHRYLRDVVLTSGPSVTQVYPSYTAVMKEIEWTMRANVPDPFGEDVLVTQTLGSGQWVVPEVVCSLGEAVRVNYISNPSGEYGILGWTVASPGSTLTNPTSATAKTGTHVLRLTHTVANTTPRTVVLDTLPVLPGTPWTFTLPVRTSKAGRKISAGLSWSKGATSLGFALGSLVTSDSLTDWQEVVVSATAPPGADTVVVTIGMDAPAGGFIANEYVEFDGLLLEQTYGTRAYFDGDSQYGTWDSTPGNSASEYQRTTAALVFDPDCPPTPDAPRPPDIVNLCLTTPETWIRYVLEVPALATAPSPRTAPVVTITTGANDARGVRVRVYANPFARTIEDLDPCAYCGEFLISYLPASSSLTVDAADKTATVVTPQGEQSALSLLFGSDGGPVTWPLLGCTIPYLVTVDVDADVAPLIAASLSVTPIF